MRASDRARARLLGLALLVLPLFGALPGMSPAQSAAADCAPGVIDIRDHDSDLRFTAEVVDTMESRSRGLMFRKSLPQFTGMLFVYEEPQPVAFWMRNTLIPLDMLFFDGTGTLTRIHSNAVPHDETPIMGGNDIRYVLEINGGLAAQLGIDLGAELRTPALDQAAAAWACAS